MLSRFVLYILLPALLAGQTADLSDDVLKLLKEPRLWKTQLTLKDGSTIEGTLVRVTNQFVAVANNSRPPVCEDIDLSKIATIQWLGAARHAGIRPGTYVAYGLFFGGVLAPFYGVHALMTPFKRLSPPLQPLSGTWEAKHQSAASSSILVFQASTVRYRTTITTKGRWRLENGILHLAFVAEPESTAAFHFDCGQLVMEKPNATFQGWFNTKRATAPILGNWHSPNRSLDLREDGSATRQDWQDRNGTFVNGATNVQIHWNESTGPGGGEWVGKIEHHHIVINIGGVLTEYRYAPPDVGLDL